MDISNRRKFLIGYAFAVMLFLGIIINLKGVVNPLIQEDYNINYSQLGFVVSSFSLGSIVATSIGGVLIQKLGLKKNFISGFLFSSIALVGVSFTDQYQSLILVMVLLGYGIGTLNVSANTLVSKLFTKEKGKMMNRFHLFFGVGGFIAPLYASLVFKFNFNWEATYSFGIVFVIILLVSSLFSNFPSKRQEQTQESVPLKVLLADRRVLIFMFIFGLDIGLEVGLASWLGVYLDDVQMRSKEEISFYISVFFILFTLGRLLASMVVEKFEYLKFVILTTVVTILLLGLGLLGPNSFAIFFSMTGFFIAMNFPTLQAAMFQTFKKNVSVILGATLTAGSLGNVILANWLTGLLNDLLGIRIGYGVMIFYGLFLIGLVYYVHSSYVKNSKAN